MIVVAHMQTIHLARPVVLRLTIGRAIVLKERGLLDILAIPGNVDVLANALADPFLFTDILWECLDTTGLTRETFADMLTPESLKELQEAFTREVIVFFPPAIQTLFRAVLDANNDPSNPTTAGETSGDLPEPLPSIPARSHFENSITCTSAGNVPTGNPLPL